MARIRSIKPEFPQSESMGSVSRDARLLFVLLWTIADDHGRTRAHSRMLASLLFPYDDDAGQLMPEWLAELENEGCIRLYEVYGSKYLEIVKWTTHQKIDKPSKPQFPLPADLFDDTSEDSARPRETLGLDRKGKEGIGEEGIGEEREERAHQSENEIILDAYHRILPKCQRATVLNPKRKRRLAEAVKLAKSVCKSQNWPYVAGEFWEAYFAECARDPWMRGEVSNPKNPSWRQNLDVLLAEDRFAGVMDRAIGSMREAA